MHRKLFPLIKAMFIETNPTPVKAAMNMLGMAAGDPRLPLVPPTENSLKVIRQALVDYGLPAGSAGHDRNPSEDFGSCPRRSSE
jgi:4-hydroxy-tetrahydrodipicolinate synthase